MKKILFLLLIVQAFGCGESQNQIKTNDIQSAEKPLLFDFKGKLYQIGNTLDTLTCEIVNECDCCSGNLFFLNDSVFIRVDYCYAGNTLTKGKYKVSGKLLKLIPDSLCIKDEYNWEAEIDLSAPKSIIEIEHKYIEPSFFEITDCNNELLIISIGFVPVEFGMNDKVYNPEKFISDVKKLGLWDKLEIN